MSHVTVMSVPIEKRRTMMATVLIASPICTSRLCGIRLVIGAADGDTISSASDIGKSVRPVWNASSPFTDCKKTGSEKMTPFCAIISTPITLAPETNCRF